MPTTISTTINNWQNSAEKSQAHNLKVVGSNPTPATNYMHKINDLDHPQRLRFLGFFVVFLNICVNHYTNRSSGFYLYFLDTLNFQ